MLRNKPRQQRPARLRLQVHHLDPILPQPVDPTAKGLALPHHQPLENPNCRTSPEQYQHGASVVTIVIPR
jgi:hypothetical protein